MISVFDEGMLDNPAGIMRTVFVQKYIGIIFVVINEFMWVYCCHEGGEVE